MSPALDRHAHCSFCGARFTVNQPWPRRCTACGEVSYLNPTPVAVAVQPVGAGLLAVRRGIAPARGRLALPGGFIDVGETWQAAAVRELFEETGVVADPGHIRLYDTVSAPDGTVLIFGLLPAMRSPADLPPEPDTEETVRREVLYGPTELGFGIHTAIATRFFTEHARSVDQVRAD
ncbi:ADP-ribose pyrophosphatase YjhB (NUDIX family) [Actinoplanes campanulatus]|uniref:ADP-ribose pyrophosphatase YjhB (NUDIX family) n=1 Tax=Actinoplanes campanulatus TaxID=113559 RepID=A0A7W5FCS2_9ACTN|nr:NUDIX domain-containing protein [Actinoplanes campanulatus]MBB3093713.1 ADP-ribose pyrophosphatase YjhB (NUDIX family) [Actinoplanes campanulatus]GGN05177.1 NUDIX hydrolase [Actinoplanes campanulatus]GID35209.1 NUDIX hydrolase [Actinoplanes campanulatus]